MRQQSYQKLLMEWAKKWKAEHLTPEVRKLISQANFDLYNGPVKDGAFGDPAEGDEEWSSYPGFSKACKLIAEALNDLPSDLYLDTDSDFVSEIEPQPEKCQTCDGEGTVGDDDPTHEQVRKDKCSDCDGRGSFDPAGEWYHAEPFEIRNAIVGKELSEYVR
jgi:hypothetical protein